jgi:hypothetical protein
MSGWNGETRATVRDRQPVYPSPDRARDGADIIGIALALPPSDTAATVEYVVGTVGVGND